MRYTPMRYTPMRCTLTRYTPMRCTPVRYTLVYEVHVPKRNWSWGRWMFPGTVSAFLGTVGSFLGAKMLPGTILVFLEHLTYS
jgi:hypothetical protein